MKRASAAGVADRITAQHCEATSIGVSEPVDFVLAFYSVHEVPDLQRLLGEIYSCVRPAGKLLVVEPKGHVVARRFARMLTIAQEMGWLVLERPLVRLSRAVVLGKP